MVTNRNTALRRDHFGDLHQEVYEYVARQSRGFNEKEDALRDAVLYGVEQAYAQESVVLYWQAFKHAKDRAIQSLTRARKRREQYASEEELQPTDWFDSRYYPFDDEPFTTDEQVELAASLLGPRVRTGRPSNDYSRVRRTAEGRALVREVLMQNGFSEIEAYRRSRPTWEATDDSEAA